MVYGGILLVILMRSSSIIKTCLSLVVLLLVICLFATYKAFYYRDQYLGNPRIRIEQHNAVIYGKFDPDRSQAYTCTTQKPGTDQVGMICNSPDYSISINCTVGGASGQYFC